MLSGIIRDSMLILLVCMASIIYYNSTVRLLRNEYIRSNEQMLKEVNQSVCRYYTQLDDTTRSLYDDNTFIDNLRTHQDDSVSVAYNEQAIKNILHRDNAIRYIYFYDPYMKYLYSFSGRMQASRLTQSLSRRNGIGRHLRTVIISTSLLCIRSVIIRTSAL